jgi:hypothetical protein
MFNLNDLKKITSLLSPAGLVENFKKLLGAYEEKVQEVDDLKQENLELKDGPFGPTIFSRGGS